MKNIVILLVLSLMTLGVYGQGIEFFHGSYEEAMKKAQTENKQIFVDVYTSWCGPCKIMAKKVFPLKEVGDYYNKNYVCLKLDAEKEADHGFFKNYKAKAYPSYFWLGADGNILDSKTGVVSPEVLIQYGKDAEKSNLSQLLEKGKQRWDSGERSLELVNEYVLGALSKVYPRQVKECILDYLSSLSEEDIKKKENYLLMKGFFRGAEDNIIYHTLMKNASIYQSYDPTEFWDGLYRLNVRGASIKRKKNEMKEYEEHLELIRKAGGSLADMYLEILAMDEILFQKDFEKSISLAMEIAEKYKDTHPYLYRQFYYSLVTNEFFTHVKDPELIDKAIAMASKALEFSPAKDTLLLLAAAYAQKGDHKKAYELMVSAPFFPPPILSTAYYRFFNLKAIHRDYLSQYK